MAVGGTKRSTVEGSKPAPWYTPAISEHGVFWVELHNGKEEIWWLRSGTPQAEQLASGNEPLRHVVAHGDHVAWMGDTAIHLKNLSEAETVEFSGAVHTNDALALSEGLLCYEASSEGNIDIFCSNGLHLDRPQNQRKPRLWKRWLLFHEGQQVLLYGPIK